MTASPADSMARERGYLPVEGGTGSIMNDDVLRTMLETTRETAARLRKKKYFRIFEVDTSGDASAGPRATAEKVTDLVLGLIEEQLEEEILFLPADTAAPLFETETWINKTAAQQLVELFTTRGTFRSREAVESDLTLLQALPVVVVRNRRGDLLRLKRREQRKDNPLHGKIVIWAGGHVRGWRQRATGPLVHAGES